MVSECEMSDDGVIGLLEDETGDDASEDGLDSSLEASPS